MTLNVLSESFAIVKVATDRWQECADLGGTYLFVARTPDELSVVCEHRRAPAEGSVHRWRGLEVVGPLDLDDIGILRSLTHALAESKVAVFVCSTYDTDYLFIRDHALDMAVHALRGAGCTVHG